MAERHAPNSPVTLKFDYVKDGVKTVRVVKFETSRCSKSAKSGEFYNRGETISVDGQPPKHRYSTYLDKYMENIEEYTA